MSKYKENPTRLYHVKKNRVAEKEQTKTAELHHHLMRLREIDMKAQADVERFENERIINDMLRGSWLSRRIL